MALLGSPQEGEVVAAARAIGRTLDAAGMDWHGLAALVSAEAARQAAPGFTFRTAAPRTARKLMAHLARQPGATPADRERLERLRARLLGARKKVPLTAAEVAWLDSMWCAAFGRGAGP
ncbi:hypothetical protein [Falsiroseomonas oryzae]|uniref:hypothetical protein n=1 Tax=Falsiroseomonas oryzae TaxID=2766473 RepID=UPI0022EAFE49|nr:hypothetical protein [Roseomonas sp. MO-31]